jgi:hypothetical protein
VVSLYICIASTFRRVEVIGASPYGLRVRTEEAVHAGDPVMLTLPHHPPIEGCVAWVKDELARIEFAEPLSVEVMQTWFDGMMM